MKTTFITDGTYEAVETEPGLPDYFLVGRKGMGKIRLSKFIGDYAASGKKIYIDNYGNSWVKGEEL